MTGAARGKRGGQRHACASAAALQPCVNRKERVREREKKEGKIETMKKENPMRSGASFVQSFSVAVHMRIT